MMIYKELRGLLARRDTILRVGSRSKHMTIPAAEAFRIARVNRQIRQESIPVLYHDFKVQIVVAYDHNREQADLWINNVIDPAILKSISSYTFHPVPRCYCKFRIDLTDLEHPVKAGEDFRWCCNAACDDKRKSYSRAVVKNVQELIVDDKQRIMTTEIMRSLLKTFCVMSQLGDN